MKNILAQITANNQILFRYTNRPNCLKAKEARDLTAQKRIEHLGKIQSKIEDIYAILSHGCKEYEHTNYIYINTQHYKNAESCITESLEGVSSAIVEQVELKACYLFAPIAYYDVEDDKVIQTDYHKLGAQLKSLLDIIKKSQHPKPRHCSWGKQQTLKRFTSNAKQKILEAGAVVDRDVGKECSFEVTLTIPGSGLSVYEQVANWSGYIVNRQTQVIRRYEKQGIKVYWFFVWEHQKRGALHQHWCVSVPGSAELAKVISHKIKDKWYELLEELSVKTGIDLFAKKGSFGTWRNTPAVWQWRVNAIRKSVAAYFSKYASKNVNTSQYNETRRKTWNSINSRESKSSNQPRLVALCPSRYWGSGYRVKKRCRELRLEFSVAVSSQREGYQFVNFVRKWLAETTAILSEVSRRFKATAIETDFIYCQGWEQRLWISSDDYDKAYSLLKRLKQYPSRKTDCMNAIASLEDW